MPEKIRYPRTIAWSKMTNAEIGAIVGAHPNTVLRHRAAMKKPKGPRKPGSGGKLRILDSKIDLSKTIAWNAKKQKANPNWMAVRMRRLRASLADTPKQHGDDDFWG